MKVKQFLKNYGKTNGFSGYEEFAGNESVEGVSVVLHDKNSLEEMLAKAFTAGNVVEVLFDNQDSIECFRSGISLLSKRHTSLRDKKIYNSVISLMDTLLFSGLFGNGKFGGCVGSPYIYIEDAKVLTAGRFLSGNEVDLYPVKINFSRFYDRACLRISHKYLSSKIEERLSDAGFVFSGDENGYALYNIGDNSDLSKLY